MSEPAKQSASTDPQMVGSELGPLRGGHWREIKFEELARKHLHGAAEKGTLANRESAGQGRPESPSTAPRSEPSPGEPSASKQDPSSAVGDHGSLPAGQSSATASPATASSEATASAGPTSTGPTSTGPTSTGPRVVRLERRQELEHHIKGSPTDLDAYMELGRIYRAEGRPADARRVFQQALQIFPEEKELLWEHEEAVLARSLQQLREVTDVAKRLDTAESDRELRRCQNDWACRRMDVCRARLARDPTLHHFRVVLAEAMYDAGLYEGAIEELQPVIELDEFSPSAHLIRGRCLLEMGKELEAMVALRAASLRRSVVAPAPVRVMALRLLCETAERLGVTLTLAQYRQHLQRAERELTELSSRHQHRSSGVATPNKEGA